MTLEAATRIPSWSVRLDTEGRHYSWQFDDEEKARRTLLAAKEYLETIGEPLTNARIIPSVRIKIAA